MPVANAAALGAYFIVMLLILGLALPASALAPSPASAFVHEGIR